MNSAYRIDFAIPISKPRSSANPRRRPKQEYPGFVFLKGASEGVEELKQLLIPAP